MKPTIENIMGKISSLENECEYIGRMDERGHHYESLGKKARAMHLEIKAMIEEYAKPTLTTRADAQLFRKPGAGELAGRQEVEGQDERD